MTLPSTLLTASLSGAAQHRRALQLATSLPQRDPSRPREFFDRVVCINLDRRADRWARLHENAAGVGWPFAAIERFSAVDGQKVPPPGWWRAGAAAWGCHQSHVCILQQAIQDGVETLLILEDDAVLPQGFPQLVKDFLTKVPGDWDGLMLGGQHLRRPRTVRDGVVRVHNGNRTHAHALRGRFIKAAYQHLCDYPAHAQQPGHHVDHRLGVLHERGGFNVYAPSPWLIGQAGGDSDIAGKPFALRFWSDGPWQQRDRGRDRSAQRLPPFVVVIGLHGSGSSCIAGVLHKLGVHMGNKLDGHDHRGGFEAVTLASLCERAYPFPSTQLAIPRDELVSELRSFIDEKRREARWRNTIAGGKYPHLCAMGEELLEACSADDLRVIHINRPLAASIRSLKHRSAAASGWLAIGDAQAEAVQTWLWTNKAAFLTQVAHLTVEFDDLLRDPAAQVQRIVRFLNLAPTAQQRAEAIAHVDQGLAADTFAIRSVATVPAGG